MRALTVLIESGDRTCASRRGEFCVWLRTRKFGQQMVCGLFDNVDLDERDGWTLRTQLCLEADALTRAPVREVNVDSAFCDRLRQCRVARGMLQIDVARAAGLHVTAISQFETGSRAPSLNNLISLIQALRVSADHLLGTGARDSQ